ncbi:GMC oxidoreductase [Brevundimonas sp.]|uniref:GMC oxidoreductase n=1 Tax=Brevundimonas sp. TaxID=1871086 RepID=UPI0028972171|nr:GMC oxidoreductase [Brevundimonas sp.]
MNKATEKDTDVLIVGAGFASLACASRLGAKATVVDRGEVFNAADVRSRFEVKDVASPLFPASPFVAAESRAHKSDLPSNQLQFPLSGLTSNQYAYRQGGISNWWGGYSPRITEATFAMSGDLDWPISALDLATFYSQAEQLLRVHGDPERTDSTVYGAMPGWKEWKAFMHPVFGDVHVTSEAKNITGSGDNVLGVCTGNGHCAICPNDAKARPGNIFSDIDVHRETRVRELLFEGNQVVGARCETHGEEFTLSCNKLVLAAGGLENVALLKRSSLPKETHSHLVGKHYQDHTAAEIVAIMPKDVPFFQIGAESHVEIPSLSGYFHGIELKTLMLTIPTTGHLLRQSLAAFPDAPPQRLARFYLHYEVPPEWGLEMRTKGDEAYIATEGYLENGTILDVVTVEIWRRLSELGVKPVHLAPFYRSGFGGHHYSGTTPMSRSFEKSVVDKDQLMIGTDNLYIAGATVLPRCGSAGPTLTLTAMSLRLGDHLNALG